MSTKVLNEIFKRLREYKDFPNYQLERRVDIFINYFLERILSAYLEKEVKFVCPEFPLKVEKSNSSTKLDYLCKTNNEVIFVELKTDSNSIDHNQALSYLNTDWKKCLEDLKKITKATKPKYREKYNTLNAAISRMEFETGDHPIKVVYIAPLPDEKNEFLKKINVGKSKLLSEIKIQLDEDENIVFDYLKTLKLNIF
ncbi:MAG: hypothetical protein WCP65_02200, partial [Bacteroidota bacterium]